MSKQTRILRFFEKKIVGTHAHNPKVVGVNPDAPVEVVVGVNPEVPVEVATVVTDESKLLKKVTPEVSMWLLHSRSTLISLGACMRTVLATLTDSPL